MDNDYTLNAAFCAQKTEEESYFDGKHFEGHGNKWDAVFGNSENFLVNHLRKSVTDGDLSFKQETGDKKYAGLIYPNANEPISIMSLIELGEEQNEYVSAYPLLTGINNDFKLKDKYMWEVNGEGEFAVETNTGKIISFFDPFFALDKEHFQFDKLQTVSFAGLAYHIEKLEEKEFTIDKGGFYDYMKEEFLKENPDKTEKDFEPPVVKLSADRFRMFLPTETTAEYEIAAQVEEIEYIKVLDEKFAKIKVNFEHEEEEEYLYCYIYASTHVLNGYEPKAGDGISAVIWLSGFFN